MGLYSHLNDAELAEKRNQLTAAIEAAAGGVSSVSHNGRAVSYSQNLSETRRLLDDVMAEIARRAGVSLRRPIYMA